MSLFDRSFIITTGITVVICGVLYYYFNSRMRELELALAKQNQVLSSFIANVQNEFRLSARGPSMEMASPVAIKAVLQEEKIVISDNECDSESDEDSDDESVSDNEIDANEIDTNEIDANEIDTSKIVICDLVKSVVKPQPQDDIKIIELSSDLKDTTLEYSSDDENVSDSDSDVEEVHIEELVVVPVKIEPVDIKSLKDEKVDDLRKLVVDKGLATKEEAKKLKKNELLQMLSTNNNL